MSKRPNVILFLTDDLGYGDISCLNPDSKIQTGNIDKLAREGITFTDAHSTSAVCSPSRYGLLTGRYNWRSRLKEGVLPGIAPPLIEEGRATLGTMFQELGYNTAAVGKWHLGMDWTPLGDFRIPKTMGEVDPERMDIDFTVPIKNGPNTRGFDYFYGTAGSLDQAPYAIIENDRLLQIPDHNIGTKGFIPTDPGATTLADISYGPAANGHDLRKVMPMMNDKVLELVDRYSKDDKPFFIYSPSHAVHGPLVPTEEFEGKSGIGLYGDFVLQVDGFIGTLQARLDELGIADDTIVIFASDNGCAPIVDIKKLYRETGHNPSYIFRGCKFDIWEGGHRIPLIIKWPEGINAGQICGQTVSLADFFATFAEITGYKYGDDAAEDSVSAFPLWKGEDKPVREALVHHSHQGYFSIRKGKWKLEMCAGSGGITYPADGRHDVSGLPPIQLYNMDKDIDEQENLYLQYPEVVKELRFLLADYIISGRSTPGADRENYQSREIWPGLEWMNL